jgi:hypothetical protein
VAAKVVTAANRLRDGASRSGHPVSQLLISTDAASDKNRKNHARFESKVRHCFEELARGQRNSMALVVAKLDSMSETLPRSQVRSFSTLYDQLAGSGATAAALGATVWLDRCAKYGAVAGRAGDAAKYYARGFPDTCQFLVEEAEGVGRAAAAARVAAAAGRDARIADMLKTKQVRVVGLWCVLSCVHGLSRRPEPALPLRLQAGPGVLGSQQPSEPGSDDEATVSPACGCGHGWLARCGR